MTRKLVRALMAASGLAASGLAWPSAAPAQQPAPVWPDPPQMQRPAGTQPPAAAPARPAKPRPKKPAAAAPEPAMEETDADAGGGAAPKAAARPAAGPVNIRCDGPFAKDSSHEQLAKAFGAKNVAAQGAGAAGAGGSTLLFPNDPKRRVEITWHDAAARRRPAAIIIESPSTWRARGFRIGEPLASVEKANGKAFRLAGFAGENGGAARDWQGGALDNLSGGCQLGMRFTVDPKAPAEARAKVAEGEFASDSPDVRAAKPAITELIVGYPE